MNIAFIGLGNMGAPMAANLAAAGHNVTGFDTAGVSVDGVAIANTANAAVVGAEVVITMLPNGKILRSVAQEVIPHMDPGALLLDCSTVDVQSARHVAEQATAAGLRAVDAPVSGGITGAAAGTLTFMAGGAPDAFAIAKPLFDIMGQKSVHCGDAGAGQAAKICNNMLLAITMIGTAEAMKMAEKLGLDPQKFYEISSQSSGYNWSLNAYTPLPGVGVESPADNGYAGGFATPLMVKDLRLAMEAAETADAAVPLGSRAAALYEDFLGAGNDALDFSAIIKTYR